MFVFAQQSVDDSYITKLEGNLLKVIKFKDDQLTIYKTLDLQNVNYNSVKIADGWIYWTSDIGSEGVATSINVSRINLHDGGKKESLCELNPESGDTFFDKNGVYSFNGKELSYTEYGKNNTSKVLNDNFLGEINYYGSGIIGVDSEWIYLFTCNDVIAKDYSYTDHTLDIVRVNKSDGSILEKLSSYTRRNKHFIYDPICKFYNNKCYILDYDNEKGNINISI